METDSELLDGLWVEKYRPKEIDDIVLSEDNKNFFKKCIEKQELPHILFLGPPGSGKTLTSRVLLNKLVKNNMDFIQMNGSEQTSIEVVRNNFLGFLKSPPYASRFKYIFIDEFDGTSQNYQQALRNIMESYAENGRFICTANFKSKIIDPLLSRFQIFELKMISNDFAMSYILNILNSEKIEYDKESVELIVRNFLPDIRKAVNTLQKNIINNKLKKIDVAQLASSEKKIIGYILQVCDDINTPRRDATLNQNTITIMELISQQEPDYRQIYEQLFYNEKLPLWGKIKVNQYQNTHQSCALPSAHFMAMVYDIISAGMLYYSMFNKK